ncbi:hypothetical protein LV78_006875 [Actinosynnema pretiosum]|nr:hypothetical protein [Actinosynnema pretiosum]
MLCATNSSGRSPIPLVFSEAMTFCARSWIGIARPRQPLDQASYATDHTAMPPTSSANHAGQKESSAPRCHDLRVPVQSVEENHVQHLCGLLAS